MIEHKLFTYGIVTLLIITILALSNDYKKIKKNVIRKDNTILIVILISIVFLENKLAGLLLTVSYFCLINSN